MAALPAEPAPAANRFGTVLTAVLVVALSWVAAKWTWALVAPPAESRPPLAAPAVDIATAARLFGGDSQMAAGPARGPASFRLKGVVAPTAGSVGAAVLNVAGKDRAVSIGGEIQPGVKLAEVGPDHVVISRAGVRERIDLDVRMAAVPALGEHTEPLLAELGFGAGDIAAMRAARAI